MKERNASTAEFLRNFYCYVVSVIETREKFYPYNDIEYSRRNGEMWEKFAYLCLTNPNSEIKEISSTAKDMFLRKVRQSIDNVVLRPNGKELKQFKAFVGSLIEGINLKLDFVGQRGSQVVGIDFKSGFGSNEKGNTSRILQVGTAFSFAEIDIKLYLLVRQDQNNSYLSKISESREWDVRTGRSAYKLLEELSGQNLLSFLEDEVDFISDMSPMVVKMLRDNVTGIEKYTNWLR